MINSTMNGNAAAMEASLSSVYVEDFIDAMQNLPNIMEPNLTQIQQLDLTYYGMLCNLNELKTEYLSSLQDQNHRQEILHKMINAMLKAESNGSAKLNALATIAELVSDTRQKLDNDNQSFGSTRSGSSTSRRQAGSRDSPAIEKYRFSNRVNGEEVVDLLTRSAQNKRARRQKQFGSEFIRHSPSTPNNERSTPTTRSKPLPKTINGKFEKSKPFDIPGSPAESIEDDDTEESGSTDAPKVQTPSLARSSSASAGKRTDKRAPKRQSKPAINTPPNKESRIAESSSAPSRSARRRQISTSQTSKDMRETRQARNKGQQNGNDSNDDNDEKWCICDRGSYGEMVKCDNDHCAIEWFHFNCMKLAAEPKGKWYCFSCRGDRPSVMKSNRPTR